MGSNLYHIFILEDSSSDIILMQLALEEFKIPFKLTEISVDNKWRPEFESALGNDGVFPIVILDRHTPWKDGLEMIAELRADISKDDCPIVLLSGVQEEEVINQAYYRGANVYIQKPMNFFELGELMFKLTTFLKNSYKLKG